MSTKNSIAYTITADQIADIVAAFYLSHRVPLFTGKPGIAKTAFVREGAAKIAQMIKKPVAVRELHLASMSEVDVRGYLVPENGRAVFTKPEFWDAVEASEHGILFLDEFAQATHEVQKAVSTLILEGRIGEYALPKGWSVMLAGNGLDDNAGTNTLLSHIINRVTMISVRAPQVDVWVSWAATVNLPFEITAMAKLRPDVVFDSEIPATPNTPYCTPRSMHILGDIANQYPGGLRAMVESSLGMAILSGTIGQGAATELSALVRTAINLPSYEDVVSAPETTIVPTKEDQKYAMVMLMAVRAQIPHSEQVCTYLARFAPNYAVTGIVSLVRRDRTFAASNAMRTWVMANRELLTKFNKYITESV
jgi:hypothetical protein